MIPSLSTSSSFSQSQSSKVTNPLLIEPGMPRCSKTDIEILENVDELGSGSCSSTHLAYHRATDTNLAVKLSDHSTSVDLRFNEEVKILKYIRKQLGKDSGKNGKWVHKVSNSLVEFRGYDTDKYQNLLVLEYCDTDLQKKLDREYRINEKEVRKMVKQLAPCLEFLHKIGVVHRDIKPSNILLKVDKVKNGQSKNSPRHKQQQRNNTSSNVYKLTDFDLAYCDYRANTGKFDKKLEMQDVVGSIEYMSPEIASNLLEESTEIELEHDFSYTEKTDIWSFGVMLYQVLTGERPFTNVESPCGEDCDSWNYGESCIDCEESVLEAICDYQVEFPERLWRDISWEAKDLVKKCLIGDCDKRISAEEIMEHPFVTRKRCVSGKGNGKTQILPFGKVKTKINAGMSTSATKQFLSPIKNHIYQKSTSLPSMGDALDSLPNPFDFFV